MNSCVRLSPESDAGFEMTSNAPWSCQMLESDIDLRNMKTKYTMMFSRNNIKSPTANRDGEIEIRENNHLEDLEVLTTRRGESIRTLQTSNLRKRKPSKPWAKSIRSGTQGTEVTRGGYAAEMHDSFLVNDLDPGIKSNEYLSYFQIADHLELIWENSPRKYARWCQANGILTHNIERNGIHRKKRARWRWGNDSSSNADERSE